MAPRELEQAIGVFEQLFVPLLAAIQSFSTVTQEQDAQSGGRGAQNSPPLVVPSPNCDLMQYSTVASHSFFVGESLHGIFVPAAARLSVGSGVLDVEPALDDCGVRSVGAVAEEAGVVHAFPVSRIAALAPQAYDVPAMQASVLHAIVLPTPFTEMEHEQVPTVLSSGPSPRVVDASDPPQATNANATTVEENAETRE